MLTRATRNILILVVAATLLLGFIALRTNDGDDFDLESAGDGGSTTTSAPDTSFPDTVVPPANPTTSPTSGTTPTTTATTAAPTTAAPTTARPGSTVAAQQQQTTVAPTTTARPTTTAAPSTTAAAPVTTSTTAGTTTGFGQTGAGAVAEGQAPIPETGGLPIGLALASGLGGGVLLAIRRTLRRP